MPCIATRKATYRLSATVDSFGHTQPSEGVCGRISLKGDLTKHMESGWVLSTSGSTRKGGWGWKRFGVLFQFSVIHFSPDTKSGEGGSASHHSREGASLNTLCTQIN